jgi:hypothetical protein
MAGMEVLGRLCNVIPIAAGQAFKMRGCSTVMVVCTTTSTGTFTLNQSSSYGGSYTAFAAIKNVYWSTQTNGTASWSKLNYVSGTAPFTSGPLSAISLGSGGTTGLTTATVAVFHVFTSELSDPNDYLQVVVSGSNGLVSVMPSDLVTQRGPANLEILGA